MPITRAKFRCEYKKQMSNGIEIAFQPVTGGSAENESFFKWTPYGECRIGLINPDTAATFEVGKFYYLDFTPAEA